MSIWRLILTLKPISNIQKDNENLLQPGIKLREEGIQLLESKFKSQVVVLQGNTPGWSQLH